MSHGLTLEHESNADLDLPRRVIAQRGSKRRARILRVCAVQGLQILVVRAVVEIEALDGELDLARRDRQRPRKSGIERVEPRPFEGVAREPGRSIVEVAITVHVNGRTGSRIETEPAADV